MARCGARGVEEASDPEDMQHYDVPMTEYDTVEADTYHTG
jgi:hypothetical protein